jgi:hypothetical protein
LLPTAARAQDDLICGRRTDAIDGIGLIAGKPFSATRITSITNAPSSTIRPKTAIEYVARDSAGRIRSEYPRSNPKVVRLSGTAESTIHVMSCPDGMDFTLLPGGVARVLDFQKQVITAITIPASSLISHMAPRGAVQSDSDFEDLGTNDIGGIKARGFRATYFGQPGDGAWAGKPIETIEYWISDDLATTLIETRTNLTRDSVRKVILTGIKREEPTPSLFAVPDGYKVIFASPDIRD